MGAGEADRPTAAKSAARPKEDEYDPEEGVDAPKEKRVKVVTYDLDGNPEEDDEIDSEEAKELGIRCDASSSSEEEVEAWGWMKPKQVAPPAKSLPAKGQGKDGKVDTSGLSLPPGFVKDPAPCIGFLEGNCKFGDLCGYTHDASAKLPPLPDGTGGSASSSVQNAGMAASSGPAQSANPQKSPQPCTNFLKGACKYGEWCGYSHERPVGQLGNGGKPVAGSPAPALPVGAVESSSTLCHNFATTGACKFGDSCAFSHNKSTAQQAAPVQKSSIPCTNFLKGDCKYGDWCGYTHDAKGAGKGAGKAQPGPLAGETYNLGVASVKESFADIDPEPKRQRKMHGWDNDPVPKDTTPALADGEAESLAILSELRQELGMANVQAVAAKAAVAETSSAPTNICLLYPMFAPQTPENRKNDPGFFTDIQADVKRECQNFGAVNEVWVNPSSQGDVWVNFAAVESAVKCQVALHKRWFAGSQITAEYATDENWKRNQRDCAASVLE